jgi:hypothetical protein
MGIETMKRREYLEDIAINGRIEMHVERRVMQSVDCICLAVSGYKIWMFRTH